MPPEKSASLIDHIIQFIKQERELYGDFNVDPQQQYLTSGKNEAKDSSATTKSAVTQESMGDDNQSSTQTSDHMENFNAQEKLFDDDSNREVYYKIKDCNTLDELEELCRQADVLKTDLADTNLVFGVGNPNADLMLIGEAPGAEEDKQGEPFVGRAGQLLNKILHAINFEREDVYISNILKHRPPNNRNPKPEERQRSLPFLMRQIDIIKPKLILCLGKVAAQTLLDNDNSLGSMRGKFHNFQGKYELMATYHPAALLRHKKWKRPTWEDVQLLRKRYDELGCKP